MSSSLLRVLAIGSAVPFLVIGAPVRADQGAIPVLRMMTNITELEVVNAQKLWCGSLLNIGDVTPFVGPDLMRVGGCGHAAAPC